MEDCRCFDGYTCLACYRAADTVPCYYCGQPRDRATYATTECPCGRAEKTRQRAMRGESRTPIYRAPSQLEEQCMRAWEQKRGLR